MSKRVYHFELPYDIPGWKISLGRSRIQGFPGYGSIPQDLRQRIDEASYGQSLTVSQEDLDRIPDATWAQIAEALSLSWEPASEAPQPHDQGDLAQNLDLVLNSYVGREITDQTKAELVEELMIVITAHWNRQGPWPVTTEQST